MENSTRILSAGFSLFFFFYRVFYIKSSLVKSPLEVSYYISSVRFFIDTSLLFLIRSGIVSKVSYYFESSSVFDLYVSGTRSSFVCSTLVFQVSYYLAFPSLCCLYESDKRASIGIALSQSYFASFCVLYIGKTASRPSNMYYGYFLFVVVFRSDQWKNNSNNRW